MFQNIDRFRENLPDYARDIRLNISTVLTTEGAPGLELKQIHGIALASAYSTKDRDLITAIENDAVTVIGDAEKEAAKLASTLMAMNNVYYRAVHLMNQQDLNNLPARLRMNGIAKPGIERKDFELYCLAISAINGCGMCLTAHQKELSHAGVPVEGIQSAIRIGAVINAAAQANAIRNG